MRAVGAAGTALIALAVFVEARGAPSTPTFWQQAADQGQAKKLVSWNRDLLPPKYVDDLLTTRFSLDDRADVIVDFNRPLTPPQIQTLLSPYGSVGYIGKVLSFAALSGVLVRRLPQLASSSDVAMIEWQAPIHVASDISSRAVRARKSGAYADPSAMEQGYDGTGILIAVLDTGVDCVTPLAFHNKCKAGVLATQDPVTFTWGPTDLSGLNQHGTQVASIALGSTIDAARGPTGCRDPGFEDEPDCGGVALGADLLDLKVCVSTSCTTADVLRGIEWLVSNVGDPTSPAAKVKVANLSIAIDEDDNGKSALALLVDALVGAGVTVVAGHGNADVSHSAGSRASFSPGSASRAITVGAVDDEHTVLRTDDTRPGFSLRGPRCAPPCVPANDDLKPELAAPGARVAGALPKDPCSYAQASGTSFSAPAVAGVAAIVLQRKPQIDPGSLKDLLMRTADGARMSPQDPYPTWDPFRGYGTVNAGAAVAAVPTSNVGFPSCDLGVSVTPGGPCALATPGKNPWENSQDIVIVPAPPASSSSHEIHASVRNQGATAETVRVEFADRAAVSGARWTSLGVQQLAISPGSTALVTQPWTPPGSPPQGDVQLRILFGLDTNFADNVTQLNATSMAPFQPIPVANPFGVPATVTVTASADPTTWKCKLSKTRFRMRGNDAPRPLNWRLIPPADAKPEDRATCQLEFEMRTKSVPPRIFKDGATFQSIAPRSCLTEIVIVDRNKEPVADARVVLSPSATHLPRAERRRLLGKQPRRLRLKTDARGAASGTLVSFLPYSANIRTATGKTSGDIRTACGHSPLLLTLGADGLVAPTPTLSESP